MHKTWSPSRARFYTKLGTRDPHMHEILTACMHGACRCRCTCIPSLQRDQLVLISYTSTMGDSKGCAPTASSIMDGMGTSGIRRARRSVPYRDVPYDVGCIAFFVERFRRRCIYMHAWPQAGRPWTRCVGKHPSTSIYIYLLLIYLSQASKQADTASTYLISATPRRPRIALRISNFLLSSSST